MNIVRELRKKKGIQQKELAIEIGVSNPTVSDWERNKKDPSGDRLKKLAKYFDVDELVILGKEVLTISNADGTSPKTIEARIVSGGMDKMPKDSREQILAGLCAMFPEYFKESEENDQT